MEDNNLILSIPFDEKDGSKVAYDYSKNRADGVVDGAHFVTGRNGNAISFDGNGTCDIMKQVLSLSDDFSVSVFVNIPAVQVGEPFKMFWMLTYEGLENFDTFPFDVATGKWVHITLTHSGGKFTLYIDGALVGTKTKRATVIGLSLNQQFYAGDYGFGKADDFKIYSKVLTEEEILNEINCAAKITYTIDGVDFKTFGVHVSASKGVLNRPKLKKVQSRSWDDYHGDAVDVEGKYYEVREITLSCFTYAESKMEFMSNITSFERAFDTPGLNRIVIDVHPTKPLIYHVYCKDDIDIKKEWSERDMIGTFDLKLVEPEPVKKILRHFAHNEATKTCQITITTSKLVNIYWGDGTADYDISGTGKVLTHTYGENGIFFPVVTGCIDEIESFTTNAIILWDRI